MVRDNQTDQGRLQRHARDIELNFTNRHESAMRGAALGRLRMLGLAGLIALGGCHSFQPFQRAHQQVNEARQWTRGGIEALQNGRLSLAQSCFNKAAEHNPDDQSLQANLARAEFRQGNVDKSIDHMRRAIELSEHDPRLIVELGELYLEAGQWLPAKRQADLAIELDCRLATAWALQGRTSVAKDELELALAQFQRAISLDPELTDVQMEIVEVYQRKNQPLRALSAVEHLLARYPRDQQPERAVLAKSVSLLELDQVRPAMDLLTVASQQPNPSSEVFLRLGQAQLLAGQTSEARLTLLRAQQHFPAEIVFDELLASLQQGNPHVASVDSATAIR